MKKLIGKRCRNCGIELPADFKPDVCPICGLVLDYIWGEIKYRLENAGRIYEGLIESIKDESVLFKGKRIDREEEIECWVSIRALKEIK